MKQKIYSILTPRVQHWFVQNVFHFKWCESTIFYGMHFFFITFLYLNFYEKRFKKIIESVSMLFPGEGTGRRVMAHTPLVFCSNYLALGIQIKTPLNSNFHLYYNWFNPLWVTSHFSKLVLPPFDHRFNDFWPYPLF